MSKKTDSTVGNDSVVAEKIKNRNIVILQLQYLLSRYIEGIKDENLKEQAKIIINDLFVYVNSYGSKKVEPKKLMQILVLSKDDIFDTFKDWTKKVNIEFGKDECTNADNNEDKVAETKAELYKEAIASLIKQGKVEEAMEAVEDFGKHALHLGMKYQENCNQTKQSASENDMVNNPAHYQSYNKELNIECIDAMRAAFGDEAVINFCICNAFKYIWRHQSKNGKQDIQTLILLN